MESRAASRICVNLPRPMAASGDCLPHAAMNLGAARGVGLRPVAGMVHRIIIEPQMDNWVLYRFDDAGGFVGDTWHGTREDALWQAKKEFGVEIPASI
jgi:hypothetical protein